MRLLLASPEAVLATPAQLPKAAAPYLAGATAGARMFRLNEEWLMT